MPQFLQSWLMRRFGGEKRFKHTVASAAQYAVTVFGSPAFAKSEPDMHLWVAFDQKFREWAEDQWQEYEVASFNIQQWDSLLDTIYRAAYSLVHEP